MPCTKIENLQYFSRRYFYPLISDYSCYQAVSVPKLLKIASKVAERILTLPIYPDLEEDHVETICDVIISKNL
jgi:Predicted pyridoxal phosphate-dependent enzyme apparently involved in regulation of cell wall biogenesis